MTGAFLLRCFRRRKTDEQVEAARLHTGFQRAAVAGGDVAHACEAVTVGALVALGGGKIRPHVAAGRIIDGKHEKPLVDAAAQTHCGTGNACRAFARVVEGVAKKRAEIGVGDGEISRPARLENRRRCRIEPVRRLWQRGQY